MADCLFCKIARHEIPSQSLYEDDRVLAFLDIHPHAPGHTMVIPKAHAETLLDLDGAEMAPLLAGVKKLVAALKRALSPDGFTIGINHGKASGQAVDHLHVHIIPRFQGDGGGSIHSVVDNPSTQSLEEVRAAVTAALE